MTLRINKTIINNVLYVNTIIIKGYLSKDETYMYFCNKPHNYMLH